MSGPLQFIVYRALQESLFPVMATQELRLYKSEAFLHFRENPIIGWPANAYHIPHLFLRIVPSFQPSIFTNSSVLSAIPVGWAILVYSGGIVHPKITY